MILAILLIIAGIAVIIGACVATLIDAGIVSLPVGICSGGGMVIMGFIMLAGTLLVNQQQSQYQAAYQVSAETQTKWVELATTALGEALVEPRAYSNLELIRRATEALEQPISSRGNPSP